MKELSESIGMIELSDEELCKASGRGCFGTGQLWGDTFNILYEFIVLTTALSEQQNTQQWPDPVPLPADNTSYEGLLG